MLRKYFLVSIAPPVYYKHRTVNFLRGQGFKYSKTERTGTGGNRQEVRRGLQRIEFRPTAIAIVATQPEAVPTRRRSPGNQNYSRYCGDAEPHVTSFISIS
jgi:hypothetical protein